MAYRIRYESGRKNWNVWKTQTILALWLGVLLFVGGHISPGVKALFSSGPNEAQQAWISSYAAGKGMRGSAVAYCATFLEQAGYEMEPVR